MGAACPAPDTEERPTKDFRTDTAERRATTEPPPSESDPFLGAIVGGRYQVLGRAGEGAYGAVYQVQHLDIGRVFALKVLRARHLFDGTQVARFRREAQAAAAIAHPGIVDVTDFGLTDADQPYIVMEWLEGSTLGHTVRAQGPMPPDEVRRLLDPDAEGGDPAALEASWLPWVMAATWVEAMDGVLRLSEEPGGGMRPVLELGGCAQGGR